MKDSTIMTTSLDENIARTWLWMDQYEEAQVNQYSFNVLLLVKLYSTANVSGVAAPPANTQLQESVGAQLDNKLGCSNTVLDFKALVQYRRVTLLQKYRKIVRAARNLEAETLITEYRGQVLLTQELTVNGNFFDKPYPFVLFYSKFNGVEMCVDARTSGNDARFIRRSCTPNAEVRHVVFKGMIHLCIYAISQISKDTEVTIGFDYDFNSCLYPVECACHEANQNCPVRKNNLSPRENLLSPPSLPPPASPVGTKTQTHLEDNLMCQYRGSLKKYLLGKWLRDNPPAQEKLQQEVGPPVQKTDDTAALATIFNSLPGHSRSSRICTTPRHFVRIPNPYRRERTRPWHRPLLTDGTYGCYKKRSMKEVQDERSSGSVVDSTSTSQQSSSTSSSTPRYPCNELHLPFKKRRSVRMLCPDHLQEPLPSTAVPTPGGHLPSGPPTACSGPLPNGLTRPPTTFINHFNL